MLGDCMNIIKRIDESNKNKKYSIETKRRSVRAVILDGNKLLVIYLSNLEEYKLPGGGIEKGETLIDALKRETLEEVGFKINQVIKPIGKIIHTREGFSNPKELFTQINYYYFCTIFPKKHEINPSDNEIKYGIKPMWKDINDIIEKNKKNIGKIVAPFSVRELFMFEYIKKLVENEEI
jgi:8-oxo-dGTP pyrophosphatase MutT (NUDIX family)